MKSLRRILLVAALVVGLATVAVVADTDADTMTTSLQIDAIAVLAADVAAVPALSITAPTSAGDAPVDDSDDTTEVYYTSVVAASASAKITAIMDANAPAGTQLTLTAAPPSGCGSTGGEKTLETVTAQDIVTAIPSCATGNNAEDGAALTYSFEVVTVADLKSDGDTTPTVTLTITGT